MDRGRYRSTPLCLVSAAAGFVVGIALVAGVVSMVLRGAPHPAFGTGAIVIPLLLLCLAGVASTAPAPRTRSVRAERQSTVVTLADVPRPESGNAPRPIANGSGAATLRRAA